MKKIFILILFMINLFANNCDKEKLFWDEIRDSENIKDFLYYNKKYPDGIFEYFANKKINSLRDNYFQDTVSLSRPNWINTPTYKYKYKYKYSAVGYANKHFKGKNYQENLARNRAKDKLQEQFDLNKLSNNEQLKYYDVIKTDKYYDKNGRVYIYLYIDNYDL